MTKVSDRTEGSGENVMTHARILIVEDEALVSEDLRQQVTDLGYEVVGTVMDGEEVVGACEETGPDLVLMDIRLRGAMDGISAAEELRARFDLPVIYVTAYADDAVLERARKTESLGYLIKPIRHLDLQVTLEMALYKRRLEVRMRAEEEKMAAIGHLASGLAHDFNNLMTSVLGFSELLMKKWPTDHPDRVLLEQIHFAAERTRILIQRLTAVARLQVLTLQVVDLNTVIDKLRIRLAHSRAAKVELNVARASGPMMVRADPEMLEDLLANLILDRPGSLPPGQTLAIKTASVALNDAFSRLHPEVKPGKYVEVVIVNAAFEMSPDELRHLFDPALKLAEDARVGTGKGLALAAAYGTIRQLAGHIFPESARGQGTTFRVLLPEFVGDATASGAP